MENYNAWKELTKFIDSFELESEVSRQDILNHFRKNNRLGRDITEGTVDKNRCWLLEAGYLNKGSRLGKYKITRKIGDLTSSGCEREAYPHRFKKERDDNN